MTKSPGLAPLVRQLLKSVIMTFFIYKWPLSSILICHYWVLCFFSSSARSNSSVSISCRSSEFTFCIHFSFKTTFVCMLVYQVLRFVFELYYTYIFSKLFSFWIHLFRYLVYVFHHFSFKNTYILFCLFPYCLISIYSAVFLLLEFIRFRFFQ